MTFKTLNRQTYDCYNKFAKGIREKNMISGEGGERLALELLWVQIPFLYLSFLRAVIPWDLLFLSALPLPPPPPFPFSFLAIFSPNREPVHRLLCGLLEELPILCGPPLGISFLPVPCEIFHSVWNSFPLPSPPRNSPRRDIPIGALPWGILYFVTPCFALEFLSHFFFSAF